MAAIRDSKIALGVDPLGGAGIDYWPLIAEHYGLNLTVVNKSVDPTFRFMTVDWDGKIRMDPSSPYAMQRLIGLKDKFDIAFASDTDHDRHGVVTKSSGLLPPNHYLSVCIHYLFSQPGQVGQGRRRRKDGGEQQHDRSRDRAARTPPLRSAGWIQVVCRRSAGRQAGLWRGRKRRLLVSAARRRACGPPTKTESFLACSRPKSPRRLGRDPGEIYRELTRDLGDPVYERIDAPATPEQKAALAKLSPADIHVTEVAGEKIEKILTAAPGDGNPIGGIKVIAKNGWFAARPSGTEEIYKIYAESFLGQDHLRRIEEEAQTIVSDTLARSARAAAGS